MENEVLFDIVKEFFDINQPHFSYDFINNIPARKLKNARKLYADFNSDKEKPLILIDDTFFRSAKLGVLITNNHLFYRLYTNNQSNKIETGIILLSDISELRISIYKRRSDLIVNGKKVGFMAAFGIESTQNSESELLNKLFELLINSLHSTNDSVNNEQALPNVRGTQCEGDGVVDNLSKLIKETTVIMQRACRS